MTDDLKEWLAIGGQYVGFVAAIFGVLGMASGDAWGVLVLLGGIVLIVAGLILADSVK